MRTIRKSCGILAGIVMLATPLAAQLQADFSITPRYTGCLPHDSQFQYVLKSTSTGNVRTYRWLSDSRDATVNYASSADAFLKLNPGFTPSVVHVTLIVSDSVSSDTITKPITVTQRFAPYATFAPGENKQGCAPYSVSFGVEGIAKDQEPEYTVLWDFGDGNTGTTMSPVHVYSSPGTYVATLRMVHTATGCTSDINDANHKVTITVLPTGGCN